MTKTTSSSFHTSTPLEGASSAQMVRRTDKKHLRDFTGYRVKVSISVRGVETTLPKSVYVPKSVGDTEYDEESSFWFAARYLFGSKTQATDIRNYLVGRRLYNPNTDEHPLFGGTVQWLESGVPDDGKIWEVRQDDLIPMPIRAHLHWYERPKSDGSAFHVSVRWYSLAQLAGRHLTPRYADSEHPASDTPTLRNSLRNSHHRAAPRPAKRTARTKGNAVCP